MSETGNTIWRPSVEPTGIAVPFPSPTTTKRLDQRQVYTKTSLVAAAEQAHHRSQTSYNRAVTSASQSYNSSPRPFRRPQDQQSSPSLSASVNNLPSLVSCSNQEQLQQQVMLNDEHLNLRTPQRVNTDTQTTRGESKSGPRSRAESMSPKLVHKQYNSPLDLYSMNNIRKTIEAHTELIAPGVKGINFMKSDTPINKQSEVYRLVKEEEEQRTHREACSHLSPISGQPLRLPSACLHSADQTAALSNSHQEQSRSVAANQQQLQSAAATTSTAAEWTSRRRQQQQAANKASGQVSSRSSACPACCECGQSIVGPFAKINDRFVHPHCFNCTTCGTSLKNTGYFTIEEKLYCEIHAKQVAKMMRISFNFSSSQQQATHLDSSAAQSRLEGSEHSAIASMARHAGQTVPSSNSGLSAPLSPLQPADARGPLVTFGSPATISTMFSNRSQSQECVERPEQKYTRAASVNEPASSSSQQQHRLAATGQLEAHSSTTQQLGALNHHKQFSAGQQQSMVSSNTSRDRRFIQEGCQVGLAGRVPVCVNCKAQIHGPYILASQTTWCKHCSQSHFNCSSCNRSLLDIGFIEDGSHRYYCEHCYELYCAPVCSKCNIKIKGDCLNALNMKWHPSCFTCGHCRRPFGNSSFYLEDNTPYCERDWTVLFTTKCYSCSYPIEAGDKWIEALDRNYHSNCFRCTTCQANLEGSIFYRKGDKPFCRLHAR